ncbi:MAG: HD domain-containing protein [Cyanobacteria bacterium P01_H01_bin.152]
MMDDLLVLTPTFDQALAYAIDLHRYQWRKVSRVPYAAHLLSVAALVLEDGGSEAEAIAALLHDAVEDQGGESTLLTIRQQFGVEVAAVVQGCTAPPRVSGQTWISHKQGYLQQIWGATPAVQRVVLADKLHNGWSILRNVAQRGEATWQYFAGSQEQVVWFYEQLAVGFEQVKPGWMTAELAVVVRRLAMLME